MIFYNHNRIKEAVRMFNAKYEREMQLIKELGNEKFSLKSLLKAVELMTLVG